MYRLVVKNIQSIQRAEIIINNTSILIGNNDAGKSTVLKILYSVVVSKVKNIKIQRILEQELDNYIFKNNGATGEIKLYKDENLVYHLDIKSLENKIEFYENTSDLDEIQYNDIIYIKNCNVYEFEPVWEHILKNDNTKYSTKDLILKLNKIDNLSGKKYINIIKYMLEYSDKETLILIEEPEQNLHLNEIKGLVELFKMRSNKDIIFTTYNNLILNYLVHDSEIFFAKKKEGNINIKVIINTEEIFRQYIKPYTEFRKVRFEDILDKV